MSTPANPVILTTSLAEIYSFHPCYGGWKTILQARKYFHNTHALTEEQYNEQFPLVDCLQSNTINDVLWLIGKRKTEIQIAVKFTRMCADSVKDLDNFWSKESATYATAAAHAAAHAAAYAATAVTNAATAAAAYAAAAAHAAHAAYNAAAYKKQKELNKQFLIRCINEYQPG